MRNENCGSVIPAAAAPCFFPVPALLFPCYSAPVFARKALQIRALAEKMGENARYQAKLLFPPSALRLKTADFRGLSPRLLQIRCICSQTPIASPPEAGDGFQPAACDAVGRLHDVGGYQFRGGNTPATAMHWVKGWPVAVKMGFAVGSAKVVVPLPP